MNSSSASKLNYSVLEPKPPRYMKPPTGGLTCGHQQMAITNDGGLHQKCMVCGQEWHEPGAGFGDVFSRQQATEYNPSTFDTAFSNPVNQPRFNLYNNQLTCGHNNQCISIGGGSYQKCYTCGQEWHAK